MHRAQIKARTLDDSKNVLHASFKKTRQNCFSLHNKQEQYQDSFVHAVCCVGNQMSNGLEWWNFGGIRG